MADISIPTSRLLRNSEALRQQLEARNIYAPDTAYPLQNEMYANNVVNSINTIIAGLTPFKSYNLKNTVIGRLVTTQTPLSEIGLEMLGKQFLLNSMSHLSQQTFPIIKPSALFDKNKDTRVITYHQDLRITKSEAATDVGTFFNNFIDTILYKYPVKNYPFNKYSQNSDYLKNSGKGQLEIMYNSMNQNIYKPSNYSDSDNTFYSVATEHKIKVMPVSSVLGGTDRNVGQGEDDKKFFDFRNSKFYAYLNSSDYNVNSLIRANQNMINSVIYVNTISQDYGHSYDMVNVQFGKPYNVAGQMWLKDSQNLWINPVAEFSSEDNLSLNFVWGKDGINKTTNEVMNQFRGDFADANGKVTPTDDTFLTANPYQIKTGLLEYTRNLLIATDGRIGDLTRKAFVRNNRIVGFNGSALWKANDSKYAVESGTAGKTGVRQHSTLDQYDRFAKAIRFNGNEVYNGNPDSVIFKNVIPRIHPTIDVNEGVPSLNNKNLMFSIENLAIRVIDNGSYGIMDDEFGSPLPICEVGPFNGRIMWFPPYNIEINETATAKFEPTVMVGRNEPMYNYMNSERGATINFTLLVDYPPQLKSQKYKGDKQRQIAEFFAFGGEGDSMIPDLMNNKPPKPPVPPYFPPTTPAEPEVINSPPMKIVFPNDVPRIPSGINKVTDDVNTVINLIWGNTFKYNIIKGFFSPVDGSDYGYNNDIFFVTGLTEYQDNGGVRYQFATGFNPDNFDQYSAIGVEDQYGECLLNKELRKVFNDEANRNLYSVYVYGAASKLYTPDIKNDVPAGTAYNELLGKRRADAAINLVRQRLIKMFGDAGSKIEVTYDPKTTGSIGDTKADETNATREAIGDEDTVLERSAYIQIRRNNNKPVPKVPQLSPDDKKALLANIDDNEAALTATREEKIAAATGCVLNQRGVGDDGILHGFQSISKNYFYPVFHSQTPEDFHKRLTFLQQCTRQGAATRYQAEVDNTGMLRARNSVFGRQPICILRIGDFFYTKIIIESVNVDYTETTWDMNPEGFGMQPMMAKVTLQVKIIGGQSLKGPIDALQNAVSFNYYANSTFTDKGIYELPSKIADAQASYINGILTSEQTALITEYNNKITDTANKARMSELNLGENWLSRDTVNPNNIETIRR